MQPVLLRDEPAGAFANWLAAMVKCMLVPIVPRPPKRLDGAEVFTGSGASVRDFWQWAYSDLRANTARGILAEYLVALAVGSAGGTRREWDDYDVLTRDGVRVEVKSSGYLQVWEQRTLSRITFSGLASRSWPLGGTLAAEASYNADVYVFAIHTAVEHDAYDLLDVEQWEFHVLPVGVVAALGVKSLGLATLRRLSAGAVKWSGLAQAVLEASPSPAGEPPGNTPYRALTTL